MPHPLCGKQKQNTLGTCWPWSVFVLFRFAFEEGLGRAVLLCQAQPRFHLELDSKAQANKGILKKEEDIRVCHRRDIDQGGPGASVAVGSHGTKRQGNPRTNRIQGKKHACR